MTKEIYMEDKFTFVKAELDKRRGKWTAIAYKSGVSRRTINYLMNDQHSPTMATIEKLYRQLKKADKK